MNLNVTFANVAQARKLKYATATGVTPQTWLLWAIPQIDTIQPHGTLFFTDGFNSLTLPHCKLLKQEVIFGINGPLLRLTGNDRRVYWHGKAIDGRYNVRRADGTIIPATERTPQQLALLLWEAMGEPFASVAALPNADRPLVNWECAPAAAELDRLCDLYGCEPTLDVGTNTAGIVVKGIGNPLPNNLDVRWFHEGINGVLPTRIEACSGYLELQSKLKLEPILRDTDGKWYPADDVSYAPDDGWEGNVSELEDPLQPDNTAYSELTAELAKDLWSVWRVSGYADGGLSHELLGPVNEVHDLLPISGEVLTGSSEDDGEIGTDGYLIGTAAISHDPDEPVENTPEGTTIEVPFTVSGATGIVKTTVPIPKRNDDFELAPADLWIVCTHRMRDPNTSQYVRYVRFFAPGGTGGVSTVRHYDAIPRIITEYGEGTSHAIVNGFDGNADDVISELNNAIAIRLAELTPKPTAVVEYNGVQYISPDGAIEEVVWELDCNSRDDNRNCVTTGYRNVEGGDLAVYRHHRRRALVAATEDADIPRTRVRDSRQNRRRI